MDLDFSKSPEMVLVKQTIHRSAIFNASEAVRDALCKLDSKGVKAGQTIALAVGSRGIDRVGEVVSQCVAFFGDKGLRPFIVPAMGSHGGATAGGQKKVLEKLGITENSAGCPIRAGMDVAVVGKLPSGLKIYFSKTAFEADWIFPINRVKSHTKFKAPVESGLCKMMTVGLGKAEGARHFHRQAVRLGFGTVEQAAEVVLESGKILAGLALLEDGAGKLSEIEVLLPENLIAREKELLKKAFARMARIPFDNIDILVVDRMGKDISGIGMDSNVTGRHRDIVGDFHTAPHVKRLFVRELSPGSDGNANGVGLADVTTTRLVRAMDVQKTFINAVAAVSPEKAAIPIHFDTDMECLRVCASTAGLNDLKNARIVRIKDTGDLEVLQASRAFEKQIEWSEELKAMGKWSPFAFDPGRNLREFEPS